MRLTQDHLHTSVLKKFLDFSAQTDIRFIYEPQRKGSLITSFPLSLPAPNGTLYGNQLNNLWLLQQSACWPSKELEVLAELNIQQHPCHYHCWMDVVPCGILMRMEVSCDMTETVSDPTASLEVLLKAHGRCLLVAKSYLLSRPEAGGGRWEGAGILYSFPMTAEQGKS